jgi:exonuclease III
VDECKPLFGGGTYTDEGRVITMEYEDFYLVLTYVLNSGQKLERLDERVAGPGTSCIPATMSCTL